MTQKITLTIKPPPGTKKLPKIPAKTLLSAIALITASLTFGVLEYEEYNNPSFLRFGGFMACTLLSMLIVGLFFYFKRNFRFEFRQASNGVQSQNRIETLSLSATASLVGTLLILNPDNISAISLPWIIVMGFISIGWSLFITISAIAGACFYTILSDYGIKIHFLFRSDTVVLWDDCPEPYMIYPQVVAFLIDDKEICVATGSEATDPRIMVALINYYRTHPEHRHELTTGETITRLTTGRLPIDWTVTPQPQNQRNT